MGVNGSQHIYRMTSAQLGLILVIMRRRITRKGI
jgi:hypothetical protein